MKTRMLLAGLVAMLLGVDAGAQTANKSRPTDFYAFTPAGVVASVDNEGDITGATFTGDGAALTNLTAANVVGTLTDAQVSDTLTIGASSTVADGALSALVTLLGAQIDLGGAEVTGILLDANVADTLTIGASSTVADGALSALVSLLGASIDLASEVTGTLPAASVGNGLTDAQVLDALTISGGTIENTAIGLTTPLAATFTTTTLKSIGSQLIIVDTDATVENGTYLITNDGDALQMALVNDAGTASSVFWRHDRTANNSDELDIIADLIDLNGNADISGTLAVGGDFAVDTGDLTLTAGDLVVTAGELTVAIGNITATLGDIQIPSGFLGFGNDDEKTISGGVITATKSYHRIDTQSDDATDDLDTINGGIEGDLLILKSVSSARDPTLKDLTGNLILSGDFTLNSVSDRIVLLHDGTNWVEISRSNNA